jgi:glycine oxidase
VSEKKFIIIGWGIAGATLAWQFHLRRIPCTIYDNGKNHSSRVAAGMVNPIVFKRLTKGWRVDDLMPYAKTFYSEIEEKLGLSLLSNRSIVRIFSSIEEQNNWASLEGDARFKAFLNPTEDLNLNHISAPFGIGKVNSLGHLDINTFLDASKKYLTNHHTVFIDESFEAHLIGEADDEYIYCEGYHIATNALFGYIPMKPSHGDVLVIHAPDLDYNDILNKNMFILPLENDHYKIGSTYNWEVNTPAPTENGRAELEERLRSFCSFKFKVVEHQAGIRPTVADRRPLLGTHFAKSNLHLFNGLGTKGVSIAPYFSEQMINYLLKEGELDKEVDVRRFEKQFMR